MIVGVAARVLVGPLHGEDGAGVVVKASHVVASAVIVLRVKQPAKRETRRPSRY